MTHSCCFGYLRDSHSPRTRSKAGPEGNRQQCSMFTTLSKTGHVQRRRNPEVQCAEESDNDGKRSTDGVKALRAWSMTCQILSIRPGQFYYPHSREHHGSSRISHTSGHFLMAWGQPVHLSLITERPEQELEADAYIFSCYDAFGSFPGLLYSSTYLSLHLIYLPVLSDARFGSFYPFSLLCLLPSAPAPTTHLK